MLITRRNTERAINESHLGDMFISDGWSLHEWIYGTVRVLVGINPTATATLDTIEIVWGTPFNDRATSAIDRCRSITSRTASARNSLENLLCGPLINILPGNAGTI